MAYRHLHFSLVCDALFNGIADVLKVYEAIKDSGDISSLSVADAYFAGEFVVDFHGVCVVWVCVF